MKGTAAKAGAVGAVGLLAVFARFGDEMLTACRPAARMVDDVGVAGGRMTDDVFDAARRPIVEGADDVAPRATRQVDVAADARADRAQDAVSHALDAVEQLTEEGEARSPDEWADGRWGRGAPKQHRFQGASPRVKEIERLETAAVREVFGELPIYAVSTSNPRAAIAGPSRIRRALALPEPTRAIFLEDLDDVAALLSSRRLRVETEEDALRLLDVVAELYRFEPIGPDVVAGIGFSRSDWDPEATPAGAGWVAEKTFLVDPAIRAYARIRVTVGANGAVTLEQRKVGARRGYR